MVKKFNKISKTFIFVFTLFVAICAQAQERVVTGTVSAADDAAGLPGVNVLVKGTTNGTVTDFDGRYSITVDNNNSVLVFSLYRIYHTGSSCKRSIRN